MTESELKQKANSIMSAIGQPFLTLTEFTSLLCMPHSDEVDFYNSLSRIINNRGGNGDAVERLNAYAQFNGVDINLKKSVQNNVWLGTVL